MTAIFPINILMCSLPKPRYYCICGNRKFSNAVDYRRRARAAIFFFFTFILKAAPKFENGPSSRNLTINVVWLLLHGPNALASRLQRYSDA